MALDTLNKITIDVSDPLNRPVVKAVQEDIRSRFVEITLVRNGEPLDIPAGTTGIVGLRRPNDTYVLYDEDEDGNAAVTFDDNVATAYLRQEAIAMAGKMYTSLVLRNGGVNLTAFAFYVDVEPTAVPSNVIVEHDYINIFEEQIGEIETLLNNISATATTLPTGSDATASYSDGVFSFGLPRGEAGEVTEAQLDAVAESKAPVITDTASGDIVNVPDGAGGMSLRGLVVDVDPVQDLHGQTNPYPAGGGKNLISPSYVVRSGYTKPTATTSGNVITITDYDSGGRFVGFNVQTVIGQKYTVKYTARSNITGVNVVESDTEPTAWINGGQSIGINTALTYTATKGWSQVWIEASANNATVTNLQLEKGEVASSWSPYSNICPISGRTGLTVTRTGVNLLNLVESEMITSGWNRIFPISVKAGTYIISCVNQFGATTKGALVALTDENDTNIVTQLTTGYTFGDSAFVGVAKTISESEAARIKNIRFAWRANDATYSSIVSGNIQLQVGSTATAYEAYSGATYPVTWQSEAGTVYGGTLDVLTGKLTVTCDIIDLGTKNWIKSNSRFNTDSVVSGAKGGNHADCLCSMYKPDMGAATRSSDMSVCFANNGYVYIYDTSFSGDASAFKTAMNGVQLVYALATPIEYTLTPPEVDSMLQGVNNIFSDGGSVALEYPCDTKLYIEKLTQPTEDDMIANANIPAHQYFMVGNTLYYSTAAIAQGAAIIVGTNCARVSLAEALNQLNS